MGMAEFLISSVTVGAGGASSIDFTSIPSTYTDLRLVVSLRSGSSGTSRGLSFTLNNDAGTNYSTRYFYGYASGVTGGSTSSSTDMYSGL